MATTPISEISQLPTCWTSLYDACKQATLSSQSNGMYPQKNSGHDMHIRVLTPRAPQRQND
eukprot:1819198-Rhodomonas_salina.1